MTHINRVIDTLREVARTEIAAGATVDDVAGAMLEFGAKVSISQYGKHETGKLMKRLGNKLERGSK